MLAPGGGKKIRIYFNKLLYCKIISFLKLFLGKRGEPDASLPKLDFQQPFPRTEHGCSQTPPLMRLLWVTASGPGSAHLKRTLFQMNLF